MKMRPLPDTDLARIAPLPEDMQRRSLEKMKGGFAPFSYSPFRTYYHDIFNVQPALFGPVGMTDWKVVEQNIRRKSKSDEECAYNLLVARGLHDYVVRERIMGRAQDFRPMQMGAGGRVSLWCPMILEVDSRPLVPFIEPRRTYGLGADGRRFAFSMMHEHIRAADEDYAEVGFGIIKFGDSDGQRRPVTLHKDDGVKLFSLDELEMMVATTYRIWREVLDEREADTRRKSGGTRGPLI